LCQNRNLKLKLRHATEASPISQNLLGSYFRAYLLKQGLISGNDFIDARKSYFRANSIQRSNVSAANFAGGLFPKAFVPVHSYPLGQPDPVFDPIAAKIVTPDTAQAVREVNAIFNSGPALASAYSGEFSLIRSLLLNYGNRSKENILLFEPSISLKPSIN
jgi:hypothetical protein